MPTNLNDIILSQRDVNNIFINLRRIEDLTDNIHIYKAVEDIKIILNKQ